MALRRVLGERVDLAGGERPDRIGQRQRRPGHAVVVSDPLVAAQQQREEDDEKDDAEGDGHGSLCSACRGLGFVYATVAGGKSSPVARFAGIVRSRDSHEDTKPRRGRC